MCSLEKNGKIFILTLTSDGEHRLNPTLIESIRTALKQQKQSLYAAAAGSATGTYDRIREMSNSFKFVVADLLSLPMPTVAAVSGHAAAAGFILALSHDYDFLQLHDYFMALLKSKISSSSVRRDVLLQCVKIKADKVETKEAALKLELRLGSNKSNGEVYADIRMNSFPEICELFGFVANFKSVVQAKSKL
ncbi:hypothetical protein MKW98_018861 [Papaver atlanticum]|uniref:Uncharacterized protein n=1 Tax=Papaver atlanticum TaxID=357466 RepID=A0AAD4TJB5_9MAGN|nr:hypothetical protein MKW98_018861 [Papaver atlanticum]